MMTRVGKENRKEPVDADERYVMMRAEDRSLWALSAYLLEKYRLLVWLAIAVLLAFGFDFKTPAQAQKALQAQIDTLKAINRDSIAPMHRRFTDKLDILLRLQCMNKTITDRDRQLAGLTCPESTR